MIFAAEIVAIVEINFEAFVANLCNDGFSHSEFSNCILAEIFRAGVFDVLVPAL